MSIRASRRQFLQVLSTAGAGLVIGVRAPFASRADAAAATAFVPDALLRLDASGVATVTIIRSDMGQSVRTAFAMLVAEELEADWSQMRVEQVVPDEKFSDFGTGGSSSVRDLWQPLRKAGATAREMLIATAAENWGVAPKDCQARQGEVVHPATNRRVKFGALVDAAAKRTAPKDVALKQPADFRVIGTKVRGVDTASRVDGSAVFGLDVRVPGMLRAAVARCPVFGGSVKSFDDSKARPIAGVRDVVKLDSGADRGVAVIADSTWAAIKGRDALSVDWDFGPNASLSDASIRAMLVEAAKKDGAVAQKVGDFSKAHTAASRQVTGNYDLPFLAHATMEPMNCVASVTADRCEIWAPTQSPREVLNTAARLTGLPKSAITVHTTLLGGGFGRRFEMDFVAEAILLSKTANAPVQVVWTREDDIRHDYYRPVSHHVLKGGLDTDGRLAAWSHRVVCPSIMSRVFPGAVRNGLDEVAMDVAKNMPYDIPNLTVDFVMANTGVPVGWWRSVYASQNAFAVESFVDELAAAGRRDPFEFRRELLGKSPRLRAVLEIAAEKSGWGKPPPAGRFRGIACVESFGTHVAEVAEISLHPKDGLRVHRVTVALDCGIAVNPDNVEAQAQSAIVYGLTAALKGEITIAQGRVEQGNFDDYPALRIQEMPEIDVTIVKSAERPSGMGEPALPPLAPAVTNALFAANGRRVRRLPIRKEDMVARA